MPKPPLAKKINNTVIQNQGRNTTQGETNGLTSEALLKMADENIASIDK